MVPPSLLLNGKILAQVKRQIHCVVSQWSVGLRIRGLTMDERIPQLIQARITLCQLESRLSECGIVDRVESAIESIADIIHEHIDEMCHEISGCSRVAAYDN